MQRRPSQSLTDTPSCNSDAILKENFFLKEGAISPKFLLLFLYVFKTNELLGLHFFVLFHVETVMKLKTVMMTTCRPFRMCLLFHKVSKEEVKLANGATFLITSVVKVDIG